MTVERRGRPTTRRLQVTTKAATPHARRPAPPARGRRPAPGTRPAGARRLDARTYQRGAQQQLRRFRQGTVLAVALTAILLLIWGVPIELEGEVQETTAASQPAPREQPELPPDPSAAVDEATSTILELAYNFYGFLPRIVLVLVLLAAATVVVRLARFLLDRTLRGWERIEAAAALTRVVVFLIAAVAGLSILAGDVRAVVGSVGLLGLAASWALQTPIESFTGWLLNSFRGYYRVGDRIAVGDVFGDVYRIDVLTTTVWEAGGPGKPVSAAQPTGTLITFPNWEVLRSNIVNYSRDFPYVWDEIAFNIANESDLEYAARVMQATARRVLGEEMADAARRYQELLEAERLSFDVEELPHVYLSLSDSWTDCTIRYLVPVRTRRRWSSTLVLEISKELVKPEHRGRIINVYPRTEVALRQGWEAGADDGSSRA